MTTVGRYRKGMVLGPDEVYVGRPTKWGNPWPMKDESERALVIQLYEDWVTGVITKPVLTASNLEQLKPSFTIEDIRRELKDKRLLCWCHPKACHADVLAALADSSPQIMDVKAKVRINVK